MTAMVVLEIVTVLSEEPVKDQLAVFLGPTVAA